MCLVPWSHKPIAITAPLFWGIKHTCTCNTSDFSVYLKLVYKSVHLLRAMYMLLYKCTMYMYTCTCTVYTAVLCTTTMCYTMYIMFFITLSHFLENSNLCVPLRVCSICTCSCWCCGMGVAMTLCFCLCLFPVLTLNSQRSRRFSAG